MACAVNAAYLSARKTFESADKFYADLADVIARMRAAGRTLARQIDPLPVFVRTATDRFRYMGEYVTDESFTAPVDYAKYVENSGFTPGQISRVIKMKRR